MGNGAFPVDSYIEAITVTYSGGYEQSINHVSLKMAGLDITQTHTHTHTHTHTLSYRSLKMICSQYLAMHTRVKRDLNLCSS